jgi:copper chaperone
MERVVLRVEGMSCGHCVKSVTNAVQGLQGVKKAAVDLKGATATVQYDPAKVALSAIQAAITDAGYTAKGILKNFRTA